MNVAGWHSEEAEAAEQGTTLQQLRKRRRLGIGPMPVKFGRRLLYRDGGTAAWLENQLAAQQAKAEQKPNRRGTRRRGSDRSG
jgi:hypothetical protein